MIGLHIISDLKKVNFDNIKVDENILRNLIKKNVEEAGLTKLGSSYHTFSNKNEITGIVALAESHISIHTWPEKQYISLDIFVCNLGTNNSQKAKKIYQNLIDFFKPQDIEEVFIDRTSKSK